MAVIGTPSARSKIIRPRRAKPAGIAGPLPREERLTFRRRQTDCEGGFASTSHPATFCERWEMGTNLHAVASVEERALRVHHIRPRAVPESISRALSRSGLQCGSVRIGSAVCGSLREFV